MSEPLTDEEIAELRKLDAAATPAPWVSAGTTVFGGKRGDVAINGTGYEGEFLGDDPLFLAAARNALPRLLDELERRRAEHPDPNDPERQRAAAAAYDADYKPSARELLPSREK